MSNTLKIGGIDPSLRNTGFAKAEYELDTGKWSVSQVGLIPTEPGKSKTVRQNSDDLRCCRHIVKRLHEEVGGFDVLFGEIPTGAQSARAAFSFGMVIGSIAGFIEAPGFKPTFMQVMPQEVKLAIPGGSKVTSKEEIVDWAATNWPNAGWIEDKRGKFQVNMPTDLPGIQAIRRLTADNEHMGDACAAINAGLRTPQFLDLLAAFKIVKRAS